MTRVALRGIRSHLGRFLLSVLAVLLGVAFVAGTFSLRAMLSSTFSDIISSSMVGDAYLRGSQESPSAASDGDVTGSRTRIPLELAQEAEQVEGVSAVLPDITGPIVLVGADGTAVAGGNGAPSFALALHPDDPSARVVAGRAPAGPEEVALESSALESSGLSVGDTTTVVGSAGPTEVQVVGEVSLGTPVAGATIVLLDVGTATAAYAADGTVTLMAVYAEEGVGEQELADRLAGRLADRDEVEVATGEEMRAETREQVQQILGFISTFLLVFAAISLFVGAFIIANTFQMVVRQRQRELAMLRAVGASPGQVFGSILVQAGVVGLLGAVAGVGAGVALVAGLRSVFAAMGMELSGRIPLDASTVVVSVVTGMVVSLVAAAVPARRAALTPPVEAMRDEAVSQDGSSVVRTAVGAVLLVGGLVAVGLALRGEEGAGTLLGLGAAAVVLAVLLLAPVVVPRALGLLAAPVVAMLPPLGALARGNVTRMPRRTASTASALMIGMALVGAAAVLAASTQASTRTIVENESTSDYLLQSATRAVPAQLVDDVAAIEDVRRADAIRVGGLVVEGDSTVGVGVDPGVFGTGLAIEVVDGTLEGLREGQVAVQRTTAEDEGWAVGDRLTVRGGAGESTVTVTAVVDSRAVGAPVILPADVFTELVPESDATIDTVLVVAEDGADLAALRTDLTEAARPYVVVSVLDNEDFADQLADQVDQVLVVLYALLGLSIVIAVLGIVNTLALSIAERTREIGLLRAVGLGRLQLASVVTIESVLTAVFGTVLGIAVGTGLAATMPTVFADEGLSTLAVPWGQLGVLLALAVVIGVVAAVWPAVRAARMDVLDAVSYE